MSRLLVRDFIHDRLYHTTDGYFCKTLHQLGRLNQPLRYNNFTGAHNYMEALGKHYPEYAFLTPVEIFQPWYGHTIANYILDKAKGKVSIVEIGPGTGTAALSILDFFKKHSTQTYENLKYYLCEISPVLASTCVERISDQHAQLLKNGQIEIVNKSGMEFDVDIKGQCFVLALEVLDNLPHDRIYKDAQNKWSLQAVVDTSKETPVEIQEPISDSVIQTCTELFLNLPELTDKEREEEHREGFIYNFMKYWYSRHKSNNAFIPTGQYILLSSLLSHIPKAHFILADFDSLVGTKIDAINSPIVSQKGKLSHEKLDFDTYLVNRGEADIMFPTDFKMTQAIVKQLTGRSGKVWKSYKFMEEYAKTKWTETKTGYRPMFDDFKNTSIFTSEEQP